ncbi:MAG: alpha-2-macroglobulin family protein [Candidatus Omnitrophota bacterium]|nr:alpha-2-macroglobulin family protein [Candidatus Omnitrophota bacterium]
MKIVYKLMFLFSFCLLFFNGITFVSDIEKADQLFEKGTFQEALKVYDSLFKDATDPEIKWKAFFRSCESLAHLYRYGESAQRLIDTPLPTQMPYRARVLILKAEMFRNFLMQYSYIQSRDVVDEEGKKEIFRLTQQEVKDAIEKAYQELWGLRSELVKIDIKNEGYFLEIKNIDFGMYPTLFDYLTFSWTNFLIGEASHITEKTISPEAELLLVEDFNQPLNFHDTPALITAQLMEEASRFNPQNRIEASERWKIRRLISPLRVGIYEFKDRKTYTNKAKEILLKWMATFKTKEAKAEAGYEAAGILNSNNEFLEAVKLCEKIEKDFSGTYAAIHAKRLRLQIQMPQLTLQAKTVMPPAKEAFTITTRNLKKVYFRLYRIDPEKLKEEATEIYKEKYKGNYNPFRGWSNLLQRPDKDWLERYISKNAPKKEWNVQTEDKSDYKTLTKTIAPPAIETGIYLVLASADNSFKINSSLIKTCFLNVTDLVLVGTTGFSEKTLEAYYDCIDKQGEGTINDDAFRFYALNAQTGKPEKEVDLKIHISESNIEKDYNINTDEKGFVSLPFQASVFPSAYNYYYADPLAKKGQSFSYWSYSLNFGYNAPNPIILFIETDRPIYRPGQKLQAKVVAARRTAQGFKSLSNDQTVLFSARDPNGKEFFNEEVRLNEFGSAAASFEIPMGRLLGNYYLYTSCSDGRFKGESTTYFSVEEYKRPEFEIVLQSAKEPWKYTHPVEIKGTVKYYFGGPVPNAPIKYRIKRQVYIPWFYRYWLRENYAGDGAEIASGDAKTDNNGEFVIPFTPTAPPKQSYQDKIPDISSFMVEVEGRDAGGRTIQAQQSYKAGKNAVYFVIEPKKGFFLEKENIEIESKQLTINDTAAEGKSNYEVFLLANVPAKPLADAQNLRYYRNYWTEIPPLDVQLKDVPNDKLVASGEIEHDKKGKGLIKLTSLSQGAYRIIQKTKDTWGEEVKQEKIFVVAKNTKEAVPVNAASVTLADKDEYEIGEVAKFIFGSGLASGIYNIELWAGDYLLSHQLIETNQPVRMIEIPVTEKMKGGFTLRWFGIKNLEGYYGQATVSVPWKEKKLSLSLEPFNKELKPGEEATWGLLVKDKKGLPQKAEVLTLMYDRSLEYYVTRNNPWLDNLYTLRPTTYSGTDSAFNPYVIDLPVTEGLLEKLLREFRAPAKEPQPPALRTWRTWADWYGEGGAVNGVMSYDKECKREEVLAESAVASGIQNAAVLEKSKSIEQQVKKVETRKEFADTAFFMPHLVTLKDGRAKFTFKAPEQLTSWKIKAFAFTKDIKEGVLSEEAVTKKDLMVRLDLPRFFREKDKGTITVIVHNESEVPMEGDLSIDVTENDKSINDTLKLVDNKKHFKVEPHNLQSFNWSLEIPQGVATYKVRATAVTGKLSDAEERELPILPSRERLVESAFISLLGSESKKLEIKLKDDPTRINESMVLEVNPQLTLSLLNTIPFLVSYPYECVEQVLNKYVPLAVINEIYQKYPSIQKAVSKIPKRTTVTPAWEKDDPKRLITLMETPWIWQSEGRPSSFPIIDLLEPAVVKAQKDITFDKLKSAQLSNGAFPWWPGGKPDPYMTLYVLSGLAEARRYGVDVPKDMIGKALRYVNSEIPLRLKPEEYDLALVSYAAYVVTSFSPNEFPEAKAGYEAAKSWVVFLEKHIYALTPFGKAYLAYTYLRLGDQKRANEVLDMAMDGVREDSIAGVYWAPEKYSWVWYSDTVEKHAFFLRTLQELRPEDKRISGMVQWLLFNRKGNVWKSTKASVAAVYALLDYLNKRGALESNETFKVNWGKDNYSTVVKPDDWLDKPLRWQETGFEITPDKTSATIEKEGPGFAFASLTWIYSTDQLPEVSAPGMLNIERAFYRRVKEGDAYHLKPIKSEDIVKVGDQIEVQLKINTRSQFEYMHLKDVKAAGFETETLLSGWKYEPLGFYEEPRDSLTNFFIDWLPQGEYIMSYRLRPTKPGVYRVGAATLQSMYAPEMTAHSSGFIIKVED